MRFRKGLEDKSRLGRLLINRGYVSEGQLEEALLAQRRSGQRLGEVLIASGWVSEKELHRVLRHQARYRNAAALVTLVTLPFQPLVSLASTNTSAARMAIEAGEFYQRSGFVPLSEAEMATVAAQSGVGLSERVEGVKLAATIFVPVLSYLDSELTISGIHFREGAPRYSIREDGALRLAFPERVEEIRMDTIRVSGDQSPSMGNISIHNIRFHPDSHMTIYTR